MTTSFLNKAQSLQFTTPLKEKEAELFAMAVLLEQKTGRTLSADKIEDKEKSIAMDIIFKRIKAFNLPIGFTIPGIIALECLAGGSPGHLVVILIDCLNKYEDKMDVSLKDLSDIYPFGFYNDTVFGDYVDNYIKEKKIKWSFIY
jgi:hypothetical protein